MEPAAPSTWVYTWPKKAGRTTAGHRKLEACCKDCLYSTVVVTRRALPGSVLRAKGERTVAIVIIFRLFLLPNWLVVRGNVGSTWRTAGRRLAVRSGSAGAHRTSSRSFGGPRQVAVRIGRIGVWIGGGLVGVRIGWWLIGVRVGWRLVTLGRLLITLGIWLLR
jgi:hypothetical protein